MLAVLRAAVIALVLLAMLRPTLVYTQTKKQAATLVVLADQSRSMSVPDAMGSKSRWEALRDALKDAAPALAEAGARLRDQGLHLRRRRVRAARRGRAKSTCPTRPRGSKRPSARPWRTCCARGRQTAVGRGPPERRRQRATPRAMCRRKPPPPE